MSAAKVLRLQNKILLRGWQLTHLYNADQKAYCTRISGLVVDVGGEPRIWNLQKILDKQEIDSFVGGVYEFWANHYERMIHEAETYLKEADAKVKAGEYIHDDRAERAAAEAAAAPAKPSGLLDGLGRPL